MNTRHRKREDTADGCRSLATADLERAADAINDHIRDRFERSANAWTARANLLGKVEASFNASVEYMTNFGNRSVDADLG